MAGTSIIATTIIFAWETIAPLVVEHSGTILNLYGDFHHTLEDIVAETGMICPANTMLEAADAWLKEARAASFPANVANASAAMMVEHSKGDTLERMVVYSALVGIIKRFASAQVSRAEAENVEDYVVLAGQTSGADDSTEIGEDDSGHGSGDDADTEDDEWSIVSYD